MDPEHPFLGKGENKIFENVELFVGLCTQKLSKIYHTGGGSQIFKNRRPFIFLLSRPRISGKMPFFGAYLFPFY